MKKNFIYIISPLVFLLVMLISCGNTNGMEPNRSNEKRDFVAVYEISGDDLSLSLNLPQNDAGNGEGYVYNFVVDWGDGSSNLITSNNQAETTHTYGEAGIYTMVISGTLPAARLNDGRLLSVNNLGKMGWQNLSQAFGLTNLNSNSKLNSFVAGDTDTREVTNMSGMFSRAPGSRAFTSSSGLTSLDLSSFDTAKVTDMGEMFWNQSDLTSLNLTSFDTSKVNKMQRMFSGTKKLTSLNLASFDTANVTNMSAMFSEVLGLTSLDLLNFNTENVTTMEGMFQNAPVLTSLNLSSFDTSKVTTMKHMFLGASGLTNLDLSGFDTSQVTDMSWMFASASSLTSLDLSNFDTENVTTMSWMFAEALKLTSLNLTGWDVSNAGNSRALTIFAEVPDNATIICDQDPGTGLGSIFGRDCSN